MRDRTHRIDLYLRPEQHKKLLMLCQQTGMTQSGVLRAMLDGWQLKQMPSPDLSELLKQLTKIGVNLNQIAWKANSLGLVDAGLYRQQAAQLEQIKSEIIDLLLPERMEDAAWR